MNNLQSIIERNYESVVKRGKITCMTTFEDFADKLAEENAEIVYAGKFAFNEVGEEIADLILTALNMAKHYDIDIEAELNRKIDINFERAKNGK